ncbi:RNA polymerase sigma factor [Leucobacter muris]|nr:sigma-70 family RNA polymerase sigma factor [Leucobacter muris]
MDSLLATHWSSQRRMHQLDDLGGLPADDVESSPEALGDAQEQRAAAALLELPERWRDVIVAVDVEGRPVQDVARSLGLSPNSTSVLLKRARGGLRKAWIQRLHRPTSALPDDCASAVEHFGIMRWGKPGARRRAAAERHLTTCDSCRSRYAQFIEQATTVGLGIAGLLALTREWRQKLVPALATSATVVASFSIPATIDQAPLAPPPSPAPVQVDESPARTGSGASGADGRTVGSEPGSGDRPADPSVTAEPDPGADTPEDEEEEEETTVLYFGDWTGWNEEEQRFVVAP